MMTKKRAFEMVRQAAYEKMCNRRPEIKPITIEGKKYLCVIMHPETHYRLKVLLARSKYKHEQWIARYNRWRAGRGESLYEEIEPQVGTLGGVEFKETA